MSFNAARRVMRTRRLTAQQLCEILLVSKRTVRRWLSPDATESQDMPGPAAILLHLWLGGAATRADIERARDEVIHRQAPRPRRRVKPPAERPAKPRGNRPR